ncbi:MAG: hypothetical protein ABGZ53_30900 [Fuerstiella sp.]
MTRQTITSIFVSIVMFNTVLCHAQQQQESSGQSPTRPDSKTQQTSADGLLPLDQRPQPWQRRAEPILSARTTAQDWCRIVCYSPHVIHHDGRFRMWYLGTSEASRSNNIVMGYAESDDGFSWQAHPNNPILTSDDVPWGQIIQTPFVMFDAATQQFRMWFVSGAGVTNDASGRKIVVNDQRLGYATSPDGIKWAVHDKPLYRSGRSPSVIREAPNRYRMWMGSTPDFDVASSGLYGNIYEFHSVDGATWSRSAQPVLQPAAPARSVVYPFVIREGDTWYMWHGCHVDGGRFELFCATSKDGTHWNVDHKRPAFPAAEGKQRFDSRYTSTPCIVRLQDRLLLYYSARDWQTEYTDGSGRKRRDGSGVYSHIGVAELLLK